MAIKIRSRKGKGRELQKLIAEKISHVTGLLCGKDEDIESRPMGQSGTDIRLSRKARKLFPYSVECKRCEKWDVPGFIRQAKKNILKGTHWLLFMRKSKEKAVVVLDADVFFNLLEDLASCREEIEEYRHGVPEIVEYDYEG